METAAEYCTVEKQTREKAVAMYRDTPREKLGEMLYECNEALCRALNELNTSKTLIGVLSKHLMHAASGARENHVKTVRKYLREAACDLGRHGYDTEASVITKYLENGDVRLVTQD